MRARLFLPRLASEAMPNLRSATLFPTNAKQLVRHPDRSRGIPLRYPTMSTRDLSTSLRSARNDGVLDRFGGADGHNRACE
jgi:hypothetical protein